MTFNSLLMFDIVFVFFLFLVGVTCLVYYLPPSQHAIANYSRHSCKFIVDDEPEFDSRSLKSTATAAAVAAAAAAAAVGSGGAEATEFEYQIETNSSCAPGQPNVKTWSREREEEQDRQQQSNEQFQQQQQQHLQQHQEQQQQQHHHHHHHHHQHQYSNSEGCRNSDQTESQYSMLKFNANKIFHSNDDDDMNAMHDVDFQLSMTNEKYNPNGLPRHQMQTEFRNPPSFCYIKAKYREIKHITGPIQSV